jgi:hypothetical protein
MQTYIYYLRRRSQKTVSTAASPLSVNSHIFSRQKRSLQKGFCNHYNIILYNIRLYYINMILYMRLYTGLRRRRPHIRVNTILA